MMYTNHTLGKLFTIVLLFLGGQNLFSATLTVCAVGCTHTTIAAAIVAAAPTGDIIDIQDPINTEVNIIVNKSLTIQGQGQGTTIVQAAATAGTAAGRVFDVASGLTVTFQDMTIRHGRVTGGGDGGGVYINNDASSNTTFTRMTIDNNEAGDEGGGVFVDDMDGTVNFTDCTISNNIAQDKGGGVYAESMHTLNFTNCTINSNSTNNATTTSRGGGLNLELGNILTMTDCIIENNAAICNTDGDGGGLYINCDANTNAVFNNTIIRNNESDDEGGGIFFEGDNGIATFTNCVLHDNQANANGTNANADAGAIKNLGVDNFTMIGCSLYNNQAPEEGGAIDLSEGGSTATFTNCTIAGNTSDTGEGGGIKFDLGTATFINCTIVNNIVLNEDGGGIFMRATATSLTLTNTIVANNTANGVANDIEIADPTDTHTFNTSLVENCPSCVTAPTYTTDPNLGAQATCGNHIYYEPQSPSDALDNAAAPGGVVPATDICGTARTGGLNTLGSFFVAPPPVVVVGGGGASIPTVSEWGMILLVLLMITLQLATSKILRLGENAVSGSLNFRLLPFDAPTFLRYSLLVLLSLVALFTLAIALFGYTLTSADPVGSVLSAVVLGYLFMLLQAE